MLQAEADILAEVAAEIKEKERQDALAREARCFETTNMAAHSKMDL